MTTPVLEAINVSKGFRQRTGVMKTHGTLINAVQGVSCALKPGERLGLVGESGCGKTTLAKLLVGLLPPDQGEVRVQGTSWTQQRGVARQVARRAIQFVFQDPMMSLNPRMTVEETLREPLVIHQLVPPHARSRRVQELLAVVRLPTTYAQRLPRTLSGGERQRVSIARALATHPRVLICDEPIASLDISVGVHILELLRHLSQQRHMALLFISHDLRAVASLCDRVAVMSQGRLIESGPTPQVLHHPMHPYTTLLLKSSALELDDIPSA